MMFIRGAAVSLMLLYGGPTSLCPKYCFKLTEEESDWTGLDSTEDGKYCKIADSILKMFFNTDYYRV